MEQRIFGKTGFSVSVLGYGAGHIGGNDLSEKETDFLLNAVLDEGINLIDTARAYGLSEERIGKHLSHRRQEFILSTKVGYGVDGVPDWTYECILKGIERALRLMHTDILDIVHLHSCPKSTLEQGEVIKALLRAKQDGKVRAIAYSGDNEDLKYAVSNRCFDSIMTSLNFCDQRVIDTIPPSTLFAAGDCRVLNNNGSGHRTSTLKDHHLGVIAKRPIANAPWRFNKCPVGHYAETYWNRWKTMNIDPTPLEWQELALRFTASVPGVSSLIVGTGKLSHLQKNKNAIEKGSLSPALFENIRSAFQKWDDNWVGQV